MFRLRVGIVTMEATPWQLEDNFRRVESYAREAVRRRAQLVIAPEAVLDGYVQAADPDTSRERMLTVAQTVPDGPYIVRASRLSAELGIFFIFGFLERQGDELFNSCVLLNPQGEVIARYSKVHPQAETAVSPGRALQPFDTPLGRVGFLLCSDRGIADNFGTLGAQGVEIIFIPMDGSGGPANTQVMRQRAVDNACWVVVANTWSCAILSPRGEVYLEKYETECVSVQRLDLYDTPQGKERSRFMGRRPDLYGPLTQSREAERLFDDQGRVTPYEEEQRAKWLAELRKLKER